MSRQEAVPVAAGALPGAVLRAPVTLQQSATVFVVYLVLGWLGITYGTIGGSSLSMLWLPSGISLAACVRYGTGIWPAIWLGSFATNAPFLVDAAAQSPVLKAVLVGALSATINTGVQALFAHALYRRYIADGNIQSARAIVNFLFKVALPPSVANMLLLTLLLGLAGYFDLGNVPLALSVWIAGAMADYHGYFVAGLFGITWMNRATRQARRPRWRTMVLPLCAVLVLLVGVSVFWHRAAIHLVTMLGMLAALYWGLRAATGFVLCASLALTAATAHHVGPFALNDNLGSLIALLMFVFGLGVPIYLLAAHRYELMRSKQELEDKVAERTSALRALNQRLEILSNSDGLTGLANRRHFDAVLEREWRRAARDGASLAVGMVDVDWFKKYNDHHGHAAGDACLRAVAQLLAAQVGRAGDLVARYGGEEFVLVLPGSTASDALELAHKIGAAMQAAALPHGDSPLGIVTASIGVAATVPSAGQTAAALVQAADAALYRAKAQGRNRAVAAQAGMAALAA
ncbi:GGDEF domain-containing protein [Pseudorhodoferax sp.]|uniref:GGDEF domain-containing protein n=1 Tax=Pseudorhodoferax sp. TaxID=1993553 RepID=UPI002DD6691B|nr:GGDEF domain-containing protein [Pseudorhodoferax sp.]